MVEKRTLIIIAVVVIVILGFVFLSNMTGSVITGRTVGEKLIENDYFRIDENVEEEVVDGAQSVGGSG